MAIKVSGTTVIDDSRNILNVPQITFGDASVQSSAASKEEYLNHLIDNASGTWSIPAGVTKFIVFAFGGGQGGNGTTSSGDNTISQGPGARGGISVHEYTVSSGTLSYTVGSGGNGRVGNNQQGVAGSDTTAVYGGTTINGNGGASGSSSGGNIFNSLGGFNDILLIYAKINPKSLYGMMIYGDDNATGSTSSVTWNENSYTLIQGGTGNSGASASGGVSGGILILW
jgi:hypothetical protein